MLLNSSDKNQFSHVYTNQIDPNAPRELLTVRQLLQRVGGAGLVGDLCELMASRLQSANADVSIIADVRTRKEVEFVRKRGGTVVRLIRNEEERGDTDDVTSHWTETELDGKYISDFTFDNTKEPMWRTFLKVVDVVNSELRANA